MSDFHALRVSQVRRLTPDAVEVTFLIPEDKKGTFAFAAGQYITLKIELEGKEVRRAYSLCSVPGTDTLSVGIKKVPDGTFSVYANDSLNTGDTLEVMPPEGRFTYESGQGIKTLAAFAAGSGITPIMSIVQQALQSDPDVRVILVYGNRSTESVMFREELEELTDLYSDRFFLYRTYSRDREDNALFGRIENSTVNYVLKNKHKDLEVDRFYLCGPEPMIREVESSLQNSGVPESRILHELFTSSESEADLSEVSEGMTRVSVILDEQETTLEMDAKDRILDAILEAGIDAPYSCQGGVCSTCIAKISEGKATMAKNQILTDSEIEEGLVLTCQAHPTSPSIRVDYDDV